MSFWPWLRRQLERLRGKYYEGPEPPERLAQAVRAFATAHKRASVGEWIRFASGLAGEAYRTGYVRGLEWQQRSPEHGDPSDAFALAQAADRHDWSWVDLVPVEADLAALVEEHSDILERLPPEERLLYQSRIADQMGGIKVEMLPTDDPKKR